MRVKGNSGKPSARPRSLRPGPTIETGRIVAASPARRTVPIALKFLEKNRGRVRPGADSSASSVARRQQQVVLPSASGIGVPSSTWNRSDGDPDQGLVAQDFDPREPLVIGDQRQIQRPSGDLGGKVRRRLADDQHLDQGVAAAVVGKNVGQERFRVVVRNSEPNRAPQALARQCGERARFDLDHAPRKFDQPLALLREPGAAAVLDEQGAAQLLLEPADMHRDRGLRLVHPLGRLGERAGIDDGEEGAQLVGVKHGTHPKF